MVPVNILPVAGPLSVMPAAGTAVSEPSVTASVTESEVESTSAKGAGLAGQTRLPAASSVTVNEAGAVAVGANALIETVLVFDVESAPSETVVVSVLATVLSSFVVYWTLPGNRR